jgi:multidrug efflux system membrane fusion protein
VKLKAEFPNLKNQLWPGELVNIRLLIETRPNALTVPPTAVQQGQQGSYVYVIKPDKTVELRIVKVAQTGPRRAVIDSGLQANEQVVVGGQSRLQPGSPVKILTGKAAQDLLAQSAAQTSIP